MEIWPRWCGFLTFTVKAVFVWSNPSIRLMTSNLTLYNVPHRNLLQHSRLKLNKARTAAGNRESKQSVRFILQLTEGAKCHSTERYKNLDWKARGPTVNHAWETDARGRRRKRRGGYTLYHSPSFECGTHSEAWAVNPFLQWLGRKVTVRPASMNELIVCLHSRRKGIIYLQHRYFSNSVRLVHSLGMEEAVVLLELPFNR